MDRRTLGGLVPGVSLIDRDHLDRVLCIVLHICSQPLNLHPPLRHRSPARTI
jgi:hypothetical protein